LQKNNIAKGTFQITIANTIQYLVIALFYVIVTKINLLSPEEVGILSVLTVISGVITLSSLNLPTALTKYVSEFIGKNQPQNAVSVQQTIKKITIILSFSGLLIFTLISIPLSQYFWGTNENALLIILISISSFFGNLIVLYRSGLSALHLFGKMALVTIIQITTSRIISILLVFLGLGIFGVTIGYIIGYLIGFIAAFSFLHGKLPSTKSKFAIKPIMSFSLPLFISSIANFILNQVDVLILASITLNFFQVGIYSVVTKSLSSLQIIIQPVAVTIFPTIAAIYGFQNEKIKFVIEKTSRYLFYTIIPTCIVLIVIGSTALEVFYGPEYASGAISFAILSFTTILLAFYTLFITALTAIGKTRQVLTINLISAFSVLTLLISLIPLFNSIGAATARLFSQLIGLILTIYISHKYLKISIDKEAMWKSAVASIATVPILIILQLIFASFLSVICMFILELSLAVFTYIVLLYILKALNDQDFVLLKHYFPKQLSRIVDLFQRIMQTK
jgi:O-antigen/teichoic acid export membrane protein